MSKLGYSEMVRVAFGDLVEFFDADESGAEESSAGQSLTPDNDLIAKRADSPRPRAIGRRALPGRPARFASRAAPRLVATGVIR